MGRIILVHRGKNTALVPRMGQTWIGLFVGHQKCGGIAASAAATATAAAAVVVVVAAATVAVYPGVIEALEIPPLLPPSKVACKHFTPPPFPPMTLTRVWTTYVRNMNEQIEFTQYLLVDGYGVCL